MPIQCVYCFVISVRSLLFNSVFVCLHLNQPTVAVSTGCKSLSAASYIQPHTYPYAVLTVVYLQYMRNELEFDQQKYVHTYLSNL